MKGKFYKMAIAGLGLLTWSGLAAAQDTPPNFIPVEMHVCNYENGMDRGDFDDAMEEMVEWMEDNNSLPYAAWVLEKMYTAPDREFDLIYMGAWPNGSTMGRDITQYIGSAGDAMSAFDEAVDCNGSFLYPTLEVKAPPENDGQGDGFVLTFSDCTVAEHRSTGDAIAAIREYGEYRDANGSEGGTYLMFPAFGGGEQNFDFKLVNSYASIEAFGNNYQWIVETAAYNVSNEMMDGLVDCDSSRVYVGDTIVNTIATMDSE